MIPTLWVLLSVVATSAAGLLGHLIGQRHARLSAPAAPPPVLTPDERLFAGQAWAANVLAAAIRGASSSRPLVFCDKETGVERYALHYKPDLKLYVYVPKDGPIIHAKTYERFCARVAREVLPPPEKP